MNGAAPPRRSGAAPPRQSGATRARLAGALGVAVLIAALPAAAHQRSRSHSFWRLEPGGAQVRLHVPELELSHVPPQALASPSPDALAAYLAERLVLRAGGQVCRPSAAPLEHAGSEGVRVFRWRVRCPTEAPLAIESTLLVDEVPAHLHFARVETASGEVVEAVLAGSERRFALPATGAPGPAAGTSLAGYIALGVEHIATGFDHLAFVLALLLLAGSLAELLALVTAFTVAHSVTLALATLGFVRPESAAVEALIGFSIALVAVENAWLLAGGGRALPAVAGGALAALALLAAAGIGAVPLLCWVGLALFTLCHFGLLARSAHPGRLRAGVAFAFGLVHGFGFAGVLAELELPRERLVAALFGFNVGVELGQLVVVAAAWPLLRLLGRVRGGRPLRLVAELGSAAIAGLGIFWFVERAFG